MNDELCDICKRPLCYGGTGVAPTECYQGWRGLPEHGCGKYDDVTITGTSFTEACEMFRVEVVKLSYPPGPWPFQRAGTTETPR